MERFFEVRSIQGQKETLYIYTNDKEYDRLSWVVFKLSASLKAQAQLIHKMNKQERRTTLLPNQIQLVH